MSDTPEWLITYTKGGKPHEQLFDSEAEANEAFNALITNRAFNIVVLYNITTQESLLAHIPDTSSSDENKKCIVHECNNRMWEGEFVGQLCKPCYLMLTTGEIVPSTSFVARLFRERDEALKKLEQERDRSATCRVISIGNELEANYYKIQVEQLLQENIKLNIKLKTNE